MRSCNTKEIGEALNRAIKGAPPHGELTITIHFRNNLAYRFEVIRNESILLTNIKTLKDNENDTSKINT